MGGSVMFIAGFYHYLTRSLSI